ncbi:MAG: hypothetical protein A4E32_02165 [Methanomassiliicoccales archaeon PtaU1.Bin124]|nr:MAG: hypothetical protein A4E32_02165 [Methanomassiliicoccales archaeon PtaU1.Bin124]
MAKAEEWSREQGATQMWLNVGGSNKNALALYHSVGYEVEAIHMSKQLRK